MWLRDSKKTDERAWREGAAVFLFFAIAISISIVSQVYNIEGDLGGFLFIWMCLALPIAYVLRSSVASLLFIVGITWYACEVGYFSASLWPLSALLDFTPSYPSVLLPGIHPKKSKK